MPTSGGPGQQAGRDIYEGDILVSPYPKEPLVVAYDEEGAAFWLRTKDRAEYKYLGTHVAAYHVEVVGNIY